MPAKDKSKNDELRYYNVKKHEIVIIILMVVVFVGIILVMPWLIAIIDLLFRQIPGWGDFGVDTVATFNIGVLPDFLGGSIGIIAGFIMEWQFFDKLKLLGKYKTLAVLLSDEFKKISEDVEEVLLQIERREKAEKQEEDFYYPYIKDIVLENVILSTENNSIIYNLPKFWGSKRGAIYQLLLKIYRDIDHYNTLLGEDDSEEDDIRIDIKDINYGIKIFVGVIGKK